MDSENAIDSAVWTDGIREIARLLNLWKEREFVSVVEDTLYAWCQETASRTRLPPRPDCALYILNNLNCLSRDTEGHLTPPVEIVDSYTEILPLDQLPLPASEYLFAKMLLNRDCRSSLEQVLASIPLISDNHKCSWADIRSGCRKELGWIWLQQLGLCENDGVEVRFNASLIPYIAQTAPHGRPVPLAELDIRLAAQSLMAENAEELIVQCEKTRLCLAGEEVLAENVHRISLLDVTAGFDVMSFETDGRVRRIEVKASVGPRDRFFVTRNELDTARRFGMSYFLAWVEFASRLPEGPSRVAWFQNPSELLCLTDGPWKTAVEQLVVQRIGDDTPYIFKEGIED